MEEIFGKMGQGFIQVCLSCLPAELTYADNSRTSQALHVLLNVNPSKAIERESKWNARESNLLQQNIFDSHTAVLSQFESTLQIFHHRVADIRHKLAEHHIRLGGALCSPISSILRLVGHGLISYTSYAVGGDLSSYCCQLTKQALV